MKKRIISIIIMLAMFTAVWPCAVMANSENELISKLQSVTSDNIVKTYYDDFDSDGKNEMFAFVGKSNSSDPDLPTTLLGDIWFVSENNIEKIKSSKDVGGIGFIIGGDSEPQYIKQNDSLQFKFFNMWGNGQMRTTICTVKESKNVIVRDFDGYLKQSDNGFVLTHSTYDCTIEKDKFNAGEYYGMARSWKNYWYYFDETSNEFKEYGGTEITQEQFLQFNGAQDILNLITEGQIYNILYRDNGIININIIKESGLYSNNDAYTCSNILVGYDDNSVWIIDNQHADASDDYRSPIYSGFYLSALNPNIAVYPEFKKNIDIKSDWAENDINDAIALGLIPEELQCEWQIPITRVDFCKLVWKLYIKMIVECDASIVEASIDFPDTIDLLDDDEVIIGTIAALGIVSGYEDGTFRPYNEITREEAAVMLARTASCFGKDSTNNYPIIFDDVSDISDWAKDSVDLVSAIGVMSGVQVSDYILDFQPKGTYTREQAMVTFYRLYNQLTRPETLQEKFPDKRDLYTLDTVPKIKINGLDANFGNYHGMYIDNYSVLEKNDKSFDVSFDVYNTAYIYGIVEVYDKNDNWIDAVPIKKMSDNGTSIKGSLWDNSIDLINDIMNENLLTYRQASGYSKKTSVKVNIPYGGYIKITNNAVESPLLAIMNITDIGFGTYKLVDSFVNYDNSTSEKYMDKLTKEALKNEYFVNLIKSVELKDKFNEELFKGITKDINISDESAGDHISTVLQNIDNLNLTSLIIDSAGSVGWSAAESTFENLAGPAGAAMKGLFIGAKAANTAIETKHYFDTVFSTDSIMIQNLGQGLTGTSMGGR